MTPFDTVWQYQDMSKTAAAKTVRPAAPKHDAPASWETLLIEAVNTPGIISAAYSAFHNYSVGNMLLAFFQCKGRGIQPGPLGTFNAWKEKGRMVKKGEKAIVLCQPSQFVKEQADDETGEIVKTTRTFFNYRPAWFVVSQTDGADAVAPELPEWNADRALANLDVERTPFSMLDGNTQGYAFGRKLAINPVAANPLKTTAHELGHIVLGHTAEQINDDDKTPRSLREVEAEAVALIVVESLGQPGADNARGYIQNWIGAGNPIPEESARKIFSASSKILAAGKPAKQDAGE